jgi:hypothetical protein
MILKIGLDLFLVKFILDQFNDFINQLLLTISIRFDDDGSASFCCQHHNAHDALSINSLPVSRNPKLGSGIGCSDFDKARGGASMQPQCIDDGDFSTDHELVEGRSIPPVQEHFGKLPQTESRFSSGEFIQDEIGLFKVPLDFNFRSSKDLHFVEQFADLHKDVASDHL